MGGILEPVIVLLALRELLYSGYARCWSGLDHLLLTIRQDINLHPNWRCFVACGWRRRFCCISGWDSGAIYIGIHHGALGLAGISLGLESSHINFRRMFVCRI